MLNSVAKSSSSLTQLRKDINLLKDSVVLEDYLDTKSNSMISWITMLRTSVEMTLMPMKISFERGGLVSVSNSRF